MNQQRTIRIGVIADTHGLFDPAIRRHFRGVDHILHAGDIGDQSVIEQLEQIAPVTAVSGNVDDGEQSGFPSEAVIELAGRRIAIRHILYEGGKLTKEGRAFLEREHPDICIFGHTHQPKSGMARQDAALQSRIGRTEAIQAATRVGRHYHCEKDHGVDPLEFDRSGQIIGYLSHPVHRFIHISMNLSRRSYVSMIELSAAQVDSQYIDVLHQSYERVPWE